MSVDDSGLYGIFAFGSYARGSWAPVPHGDAIERREARARLGESGSFIAPPSFCEARKAAIPVNAVFAVFHPPGRSTTTSPAPSPSMLGSSLRPAAVAAWLIGDASVYGSRSVKGREKSVRVACCCPSTTRPPGASCADAKPPSACCCVAIETADRGETCGAMSRHPIRPMRRASRAAASSVRARCFRKSSTCAQSWAGACRSERCGRESRAIPERRESPAADRYVTGDRSFRYVMVPVGVWSAPASYGSCFRIQLSASAADEP